MPIVFGQYRKYVFTSWTQPVLTSNSSSSEITITDPNLSGGTVDPNNNYTMTWGSSSFSHIQDVYKAMDADASNGFQLDASNVSDVNNQAFSVFDIEFDKPMKITGFSFSGPVVSGLHDALTFAQVYSIDSEGNATRIFNESASETISDTFPAKKCKKIRICLRPDRDGGSYPCIVKSIVITAEKATSTEEGTAGDHDYYGNTIQAVYCGSTQIDHLYVGNTKVL